MMKILRNQSLLGPIGSDPMLAPGTDYVIVFMRFFKILRNLAMMTVTMLETAEMTLTNAQALGTLTLKQGFTLYLNTFGTPIYLFVKISTYLF